MKRLLLYGTLGCHLCDEAMALLAPTANTLGFELSEVDIAESDSLMSEYAMRIPVAYREDIQMEMDWPFNPEDVGRFLSLEV